MRRLALPVFAALVAISCGAESEPEQATDTTSSTTSTSSTPPSTTAAPTSTTTSAPVVTTTTTLFPRPDASTVDDLLELDRPIVAGHAGGDRSWPHSTLYAFRRAAEAGVDVLEMDVQLTRDGVLVVQHDDTVDRTTQATGRVRDYTYEELQQLDNAYWWSGEWTNHDLPADEYVYRGMRTGDLSPPDGFTTDDFRVETFRAVAEAFPDHVLDVEIKVPDGDDGEDDLAFAIDGALVLADEITSLGRSDSVIVVSFNVDVMAAFREIAPGVATSPAEDEMFAWYLGVGELAPSDRVAQVPPTFGDIEVLDADIIDRVHEAGLEMWVWPNNADTQENADYYFEVVTIGVDGIIAGSPEIAVERYRAEGLYG